MLRVSIVAFVVALSALVPSAASAQGTIQQIEGSTSLFGVKGVSVPPIKRSEIRSLVDLGTIDTDGHEKIILNLAGQMLGVDENGGTVGVVLIPDIAPFDQAFTGFGLLPASLEITVAVNSRESPYFMASQQKFDIGFPRYRALAYNTSRSPVTISFFAYRTR
ncbi:MAG: hypothetical protein IPF53_18180 [Blastocatellia bacterium]|jgi:hypothetical protein|nr:hypothetical protein [Blastocatellia bacterium]